MSDQAGALIISRTDLHALVERVVLPFIIRTSEGYQPDHPDQIVLDVVEALLCASKEARRAETQ